MKLFAGLNEDRVVGLLLFVCALAYGWGAWRISGLQSDDFVGPTGFPALIAISGAALAAWLVAKPDSEPKGGLGGPVWIYWAFFLFYAAAMPFLGFGISSGLFLAATFIVLKARLFISAAIAVSVTAVLLFVFGHLFDLRISLGPWG